MLQKEFADQFEAGILHGAVIAGGTLSEFFAPRAFGYSESLRSRPLRVDSIFDLASVSKVLATISALLIARDKGLLDFDRPFTEYLPHYRVLLPQPISIRDLAMHVSGFGGQSYYDAQSSEEIRRNLLSQPPPNPYGQYEYSCWNYHLLSMIVEELTKKPFAVFCKEEIFLPLGMNETSLGSPCTSEMARLTQSCATKEAGQISDFIAVRLFRDGFNTGNAGAFSCAQDLMKFCRCLLQKGQTAAGKQLFSAAAMQDISTPRMSSGKVKRALGWIVKDESKPAGFSEKTIYHSGWSGQSLFVDFEKQFFAIILTVRALEEYDRAKAGRFKLIAELARECRLLDE